VNWLDVLIIIALVIAGFTGWRHGIVRSAFLLVGIILGIVLAGQFGGRVGEGLGDLGVPGDSRVLGFAVVIGFCGVGSYLLGIVARKVVSTLLLGWADSLGGLGVALFTSALGWSALIVAAGSTDISWANQTIQSSKVASALAGRGSIVLAMLPDQYKSVLSWVGDVKPPSVQVVEATAKEVEADSAEVEASFAILNPNRFGGAVQSLKYDLEWQDGGAWRRIGSAERKNIPLSAGERSEISVHLTVKRDAGQAAFLAALARAQPIQVRLAGTAAISFPSQVVQVPFSEATPVKR